MAKIKGKDGKFIAGGSIIARKYRKQYGEAYPTKTLARILHKDHPLVFTSVENARGILKSIEGKSGEKSLRKLKDKSLVITEERTRTPWVFEEPDSEDLEPYRLPLAFNNFILAADFHIPNHRMPPIDAMMRYAKDNNIRQFFLNGDLLDNTPFSRWVHKPPSGEDVKRWFNMAESFLREIKKHFDEVYWLTGNHDFWYERWLMQHAPILFGDPYFKLEARLHLNDIGVKYIEQDYLVKAGHLNIIHGHILFRGGGGYANAARMLYMKAKANIIASHVHVESSHTEPDLNDKIITTFTTGCMCSLRPEYQPYGGKACHGFAHITTQKNGDFNVKNFRIYKGQIL